MESEPFLRPTRKEFGRYNICPVTKWCNLELIVQYVESSQKPKVMWNLFEYSFMNVTYIVKYTCESKVIYTKDVKYMKIRRLF